MLFASRLHLRVAIKAVGAPGSSIAAGKDATKLLAFGRRTLRTDTVRRTSRAPPAAGMATGGGKDSDIVSRIGKNLVQNVKTKEVMYGLPFSQCQLKHASQNVLRYVELTFLSLRRLSYPPTERGAGVPMGRQHDNHHVSAAIRMTVVSAGSRAYQHAPADAGCPRRQAGGCGTGATWG